MVYFNRAKVLKIFEALFKSVKEKKNGDISIAVNFSFAQLKSIAEGLPNFSV
jgi:hypothetical protein